MGRSGGLKTKKSNFVYVSKSRKISQASQTQISREVLQYIFKGNPIYTKAELDALAGTPMAEEIKLEKNYDLYCQKLANKEIIKVGQFNFAAVTCITMARKTLEILERNGDIELFEEKI
jgi:hypothetical protein